MLEVIGGGGEARVPGVRRHRQRALVVRPGRDRRAGLVGPRRPRALPDAEVRLRQPERLPASSCSAAASPGSPSAAMGAAITLGVGVVVLGVPFDLGAVNWPLLVVVMTLGLVVDHRDRRACSPRSASRRARSRGPTRRRSAGALFLVSGAVFPLVVLPVAVQAIGLLTPLTLVDRGRPAGAVPGRRHRRSAGPARCSTDADRTGRPGRRPDRPRLAGDRGGGYTRARSPSSGRATGAPRTAGCSTRPRAPDRGSPRRRSTGAVRGGPMRIYEGSPRQDFEEVFRSIGAFIDQRGMQRDPPRRGAGRLHRPGHRRGRRRRRHLVRVDGRARPRRR